MKYFKILILSFILTGLGSCSDNTKLKEKEKPSEEKKPERKDAFKNIFKQSGLKGAVLIYDLKNDIYYSNDYDWSTQGQLPASTFKIPNSIIGLETGVITDSVIFKWDGEQKWNKNWMQDLNLQQALQFSCVPCYQKLARDIGVERMNEYLDKLEYPKMDIDSNNIDMFWLEGESRINQFQQIDFLVHFYQKKLPISEKTYKKVRDILIISKNENQTISGKTGLSITSGVDNGWFIGYLEKGDEVYFYATNVEQKTEMEFDTFIKMRKSITNLAFKELKITD